MINTSGRFKNLCLNIINNIKSNPTEEENINTSTNETSDQKDDIKNDKEAEQNEGLPQDLDSQLNLTQHVISETNADNYINKNNIDTNLDLNQTNNYNVLHTDSKINEKCEEHIKNANNTEESYIKNNSNKYNETNYVLENDSKELYKESLKRSNEDFNTTMKEECNNITTDLNSQFNYAINDNSKKFDENNNKAISYYNTTSDLSTCNNENNIKNDYEEKLGDSCRFFIYTSNPYNYDIRMIKENCLTIYQLLFSEKKKWCSIYICTDNGPMSNFNYHLYKILCSKDDIYMYFFVLKKFIFSCYIYFNLINIKIFSSLSIFSYKNRKSNRSTDSKNYVSFNSFSEIPNYEQSQNKESNTISLKKGEDEKRKRKQKNDISNNLENKKQKLNNETNDEHIKCFSKNLENAHNKEYNDYFLSSYKNDNDLGNTESDYKNMFSFNNGLDYNNNLNNLLNPDNIQNNNYLYNGFCKNEESQIFNFIYNPYKHIYENKSNTCSTYFNFFDKDKTDIKKKLQLFINTHSPTMINITKKWNSFYLNKNKITSFVEKYKDTNFFSCDNFKKEITEKFINSFVETFCLMITKNEDKEHGDENVVTPTKTNNENINKASKSDHIKYGEHAQSQGHLNVGSDGNSLATTFDGNSNKEFVTNKTEPNSSSNIESAQVDNATNGEGENNDENCESGERDEGGKGDTSEPAAPMSENETEEELLAEKDDNKEASCRNSDDCRGTDSVCPENGSKNWEILDSSKNLDSSCAISTNYVESNGLMDSNNHILGTDKNEEDMNTKGFEISGESIESCNKNDIKKEYNLSEDNDEKEINKEKFILKEDKNNPKLDDHLKTNQSLPNNIIINNLNILMSDLNELYYYLENKKGKLIRQGWNSNNGGLENVGYYGNLDKNKYSGINNNDENNIVLNNDILGNPKSNPLFFDGEKIEEDDENETRVIDDMYYLDSNKNEDDHYNLEISSVDLTKCCSVCSGAQYDNFETNSNHYNDNNKIEVFIKESDFFCNCNNIVSTSQNFNSNYKLCFNNDVKSEEYYMLKKNDIEQMNRMLGEILYMNNSETEGMRCRNEMDVGGYGADGKRSGKYYIKNNKGIGKDKNKIWSENNYDDTYNNKDGDHNKPTLTSRELRNLRRNKLLNNKEAEQKNKSAKQTCGSNYDIKSPRVKKLEKFTSLDQEELREVFGPTGVSGVYFEKSRSSWTAQYKVSGGKRRAKRFLVTKNMTYEEIENVKQQCIAYRKQMEKEYTKEFLNEDKKKLANNNINPSGKKSKKKRKIKNFYDC
ncbi:transcription factor with AP2 domain(s), putative [Plasmodium chabaudi chabaudi]|uniref:Transcription factor with AP2 domain(S), putative n=1 Tax=Plasmodium chabaudi chabaudi TaxID=31271 RepID=A0A1C6XGD5_PLACU|nr:transcription factor with AP2 domain(s), putative [Plasmodium chabaudi chabaudi]